MFWLKVFAASGRVRRVRHMHERGSFSTDDLFAAVHEFPNEPKNRGPFLKFRNDRYFFFFFRQRPLANC